MAMYRMRNLSLKLSHLYVPFRTFMLSHFITSPVKTVLWARYRSNDAALCNVIVCAGQRGHAVAPCRRLAVYLGVSGGVQ